MFPVFLLEPAVGLLNHRASAKEQGPKEQVSEGCDP